MSNKNTEYPLQNLPGFKYIADSYLSGESAPGLHSRTAEDEGIDLDAETVFLESSPERGFLYCLDTKADELTAQEMRELVADINRWWQLCETRLAQG